MTYQDLLDIESEQIKNELEIHIGKKYSVSTDIMQKELVRLANEVCSMIYCVRRR